MTINICISDLCNSAIKWGFCLQNKPKDLDPSRRIKVFGIVLGGENLRLIIEEISKFLFYAVVLFFQVSVGQTPHTQSNAAGQSVLAATLEKNRELEMQNAKLKQVNRFCSDFTEKSFLREDYFATIDYV